jgi:hypothetical protein
MDGRGKFKWVKKGLGWDGWQDGEYDLRRQTDLGMVGVNLSGMWKV